MNKSAKRLRYYRKKIRRFLSGTLRYDHIVLASLALAIGVIVAYGVIGFRSLIALVHRIGFGLPENELVEQVSSVPEWRLALIPVIGGIIVGIMYKLFMKPGERPGGIADIIEATALNDSKMSGRFALKSMIMTATSLGAGGSGGREGPAVHFGAAIASWMAQRLHLTSTVTRTLLACGVASAVASSFNAPIAGVFFALEVVIGHYAIHTFAPVVIAGVAGTLITRIHLGDFPAFIMPDLAIESTLEFPAFMLLGIISAIVAIIFMRSMMAVDRRVEASPIPDWAAPAIGGVILGVMALWIPEILGVGYEAVNMVLTRENAYGLTALLVLLAAKIFAVAITLGFRFGGGVFSPALYIGAMTGAAFGIFVAQIAPELASSPAVYAIVGMGAVASSVLGAPISTILIIFELTGDYSVTIAVMIGAAIATLVTGLAHRQSFFAWQLERRGLKLEGGRARHLLQKSRVREIMDRDIVTVMASETILRIRNLLLAQSGGRLLVTDETGELIGLITASDLASETFDPNLGTLVRAEDVCRRNPVTLTSEDSLEMALEVMEGSGENHIPVLVSEEDRTVIGLLHYQDVLKTYNLALVDAHREASNVDHKI